MINVITKNKKCKQKSNEIEQQQKNRTFEMTGERQYMTLFRYFFFE